MRANTLHAAALLPAVLAGNAALAGGTVLAWGDNTTGQRTVPTTLGACNTLSAGSGHSAAIKQTGIVACWGLNANGQCNVPAALGACKMVSAGGRHTAAIKTTGAVACWGHNNYGQCNVPATLGACSQVSCGDSHTVALRTTGYVAAWGDNSYGQSAVPGTNVLGTCTAVEAGTFHTLVIQSNGNVAAWGDASSNQGLVPNGLGACISIGAGDLHSAAVRSTGQVVCWGDNGQGQITVPATLKPCTAVACGDFHTIALQQDGVAVAWGYNQSSQAVVPPNTTFTQVAGGGSHSMGLTSNIAIPTGVTATDGTSTANVTVNWTAAAGASGYRVFRAVGAGLGVQIGTTTTPVTFVDSTATAGVSYTYWVKTITANGDSVASATNAGWRNVAVPTGVAATDGTLTTGVTVTWTAVTGATGYRVYRSIGTGAATQVGLPVANTFSDSTAVAGTVYTYSVRARTDAGNTAYSTADTGWRNLSAPGTISASDGTYTTKVRVSWTAVSGATGYVVYRQLPGGTNASIAVIGSGATLLFDDTTIAPGVVGTYRVRTSSAAGLSTFSVTNTGFRATAFTGDGGSGAPSDGEDGADGSSQASAEGVAGDAGPVRGPRTDGARNGDPFPHQTAGAPGAGRDPADEPALRPEMLSCDEVAERTMRRIAWLRSLDKENLAAQAEADALEALLPDPGSDSADGCAACRMARGDVNQDGGVDGGDLGALLAAFADGDTVTGDVNRDGWLDVRDLAVVLAR